MTAYACIKPQRQSCCLLPFLVWNFIRKYNDINIVYEYKYYTLSYYYFICPFLCTSKCIFIKTTTCSSSFTRPLNILTKLYFHYLCHHPTTPSSSVRPSYTIWWRLCGDDEDTNAENCLSHPHVSDTSKVINCQEHYNRRIYPHFRNCGLRLRLMARFMFVVRYLYTYIVWCVRFLLFFLFTLIN